MAAALVRNVDHDHSHMSSDHTLEREVIACSDGCEISYTLYYSGDENYSAGGERNVDAMLRGASQKLNHEHPYHETPTFLWRGRELGWKSTGPKAASASQ
ncbi:MAG TPA: hypothetical protein VFO34_09295 [Candidatus Acidoferrales bacterium]|nr:hypothetical protein [Candidatus Acidoferrales bacterium]